MSSTVNVSGISLCGNVLFQLRMGLPCSAFDEKEVISILNDRKYFDYFCGRSMKINLNTENVDPSSYNRNIAKGAFAEVVRKLTLNKFAKRV